MIESEFVFCVCQPGAELALKSEVAARVPNWKFAYSRPGFVTFKLDKPANLDRFQAPHLVFARTIGLSLGSVTGESNEELAAAVWEEPAVAAYVEACPKLGLHVWRRDTALPGQQGVEPGPTDESRAAEAALRSSAPQASAGDRELLASRETGNGARVLDVALVEPDRWWIGAHRVANRSDRFAGGVMPLALPGHAVSRAYLKMQESLRWAGLPTMAGEVWIELGCAPGGASQALLEEGMQVLGVDPAKVDPVVEAEENFHQLQMRVQDARRVEFSTAQWLAADLNVDPETLLSAVESIVSHPEVSIRGLVLTIKLLEKSMGSPEAIVAYLERVRKWGYQDVRVRQLAFNRHEICLVALRSRRQRRIARRGRIAKPKKSAPVKKRFRVDPPHAGPSSGHIHDAGPHV
ncbi:Ribosomal RNA large subunit methyltransferase M [Pseudobythopirellula maris]|uniref:Ribosomal RNA large subunit methyltransferase M n=1 Tax=Pseudobythopirellula maris TaxID=2527991 RepID=A0A5C5ZUU1_9BACT|nr:SAM-dependent methyltransferase [Pseudobythopirellula maris]TWT90003.1 Ribosomal RNA large subunit methyltransferase M [Pseudobythopirellula maris]